MTQPPAQKTKKTAEKIEPPKPKELSEDATPAEIAKAFNDYQDEYRKYTEKLLEAQKAELRSEINDNNLKSETAKIKEFLGKATHGKDPEVLREADVLFKGGATIEEAYNKALKILGKEEKATETKEKPANTEQTTTVHKNIHSSESSDVDTSNVTESKGATIKDVAKKNLEKILQETPGGMEAITEGQ